MSKLEELRKKIDTIDDQLVDLLNTRAELALQVKQAKQVENLEIYSEARERQIFERVLNRGERGNFPQESLEQIFEIILATSRSIQHKN